AAAASDAGALALPGRLRGSGAERGPAGAAEARVGLGLGATRGAAGSERRAAAAAEAGSRQVRPPAARAGHGHVQSIAGDATADLDPCASLIWRPEPAACD